MLDGDGRSKVPFPMVVLVKKLPTPLMAEYSAGLLLCRAERLPM